MTILMRAFQGTAVGLLWALLSVPAALPFSRFCKGPEYVIFGFSLAVMMSPLLALLFGPGAYLLSLIHASLMELWARCARTTRAIRIAGVLLGLPLGLANLILVFGILAAGGSSMGDLTLTREHLILIIPALAGGAGLGWGVTSDLLPHRRAA